jgi:hypothetical protein
VVEVDVRVPLGGALVCLGLGGTVPFDGLVFGRLGLFWLVGFAAAE